MSSRSSCPKLMDRPLAIGGTSGIVSSLLALTLQGLSREAGIDPLPPTVFAECLNNSPTLTFEDIPWVIFLAGFICGLLFGPAVDIFWILKERWRRFVLRCVVHLQGPAPTPARAFHKVLE